MAADPRGSCPGDGGEPHAMQEALETYVRARPVEFADLEPELR